MYGSFMVGIVEWISLDMCGCRLIVDLTGYVDRKSPVDFMLSVGQLKIIQNTKHVSAFGD